MKTFIGLLLIIILFLLGAAIVTSLMNRPLFPYRDSSPASSSASNADQRPVPSFPYGLRPGLQRITVASLLTSHGFIKLQLDDPVTDTYINDNQSLYGMKVIRVLISFYRDSLQTLQIRIGSTFQMSEHLANINRICDHLLADYCLRDPGRNIEPLKYQMQNSEIQIVRFANAEPAGRSDCTISVNSLQTSEYFCCGVTYRNAELASRGMGNFPQ
jgi:hypothetical protein